MLPCSLFILRLAANRNPPLSLGPSPWPSIFRTEGITSFLRALRLYDHRLDEVDDSLNKAKRVPVAFVAVGLPGGSAPPLTHLS
jgi:hypothetical protein